MAGLFRRARQEDRPAGLQLGRPEGERTVLERQLRGRFSALPPRVGAPLGGASTADPAAWAANVLDAAMFDGAFEPR